MSTKIKRIDVSTFQKNVDFQKAKKDGVIFAMLRAGFGRYEKQKDEMFETHYKNAKSAGVAVGAYWYSYAKTVEQAKQEAEVCAKVLEGKQFEYPVFFDIEDPSQTDLGKALLTDLCEAFCDELEKKGYYVGVYSNKNWFVNYLDYKTLAKKYQIWLAQYNNEVTLDGEIQMWQYTSKGTIEGAVGNIDMNWSYVDYPAIIKKGGFNGFQKEDEKAKVTVTYRVRANGKWRPEVTDLKSYAGNKGQAITDLAVKVSKGSVKYRVHTKGRWLNWITGYDIKDFYKGYAGNGEGNPVDAVQVYFYTPDSIRPHQQAFYRVSELGKEYFDWQEDTSPKDGMDGYAGNADGTAIDRIQIQIKSR